ncbi:MAG TPA: phenylalanine--tRNA ligase subunit beta, partial [Blastocatellia bacterium]|nr:phenylalanine--tRNA ligase subunit beta [Blastocatellia bacterium]
MKVSYNWLKELVQITLGPKELAERLTMAGLAVDTVEPHLDDHIIDIDVLSNRPDELSHVGVAREIAIICGTELRLPESQVVESGETAAGAASIEILDPDLCPRYAARIIAGVKVGPSPKWLVDRLESIGQRSVNNIADITNYVMFEMGQPTHAFDLNKLHGRKIIVRRARAGEAIKTLDGFDRELSSDILVIADADHAVALGGVMGGEETEISDLTQDVLLESAYFDPGSVRRTAQSLGMDTEASYRFARGVDCEQQAVAADICASRIREVAGGRILKGVLDVRPKRIDRKPITLRLAQVKRFTGLEVGSDQALSILSGLGFETGLEAGGSSLRAVPPPFRIDVFREIDLIEEVARHAGYDLIDTTLPAWSGAGAYLEDETGRREIRRTLTGLGFSEAISLSFVNGPRDGLFASDQQSPLVLTNPMDVSEDRMRSGLLCGLAEAVRRNFNQGEKDLKLFETGRVFAPPRSGERPVEKDRLALVMTGSYGDSWRERRQVDFYDLKGVVETLLESCKISGFTFERASVEYLHPGQSAVLVRDGVLFARFGRLHPRVAAAFKLRQPVYVAEVDLEHLLEPLSNSGAADRYRSLPRFPATSRDVSALIPEDEAWGDVEKAIRELGIGEIAGVSLFDVYRGTGVPEGMRSLAFRIVYRSDDRTLTDAEVDALH